MSHALTNSASSSHHTFDLDIGDFAIDHDPRSMSVGADSQRTKRASSTYGVALTSTPSQDERAALPSQQRPSLWKRASAPGAEYADYLSASSSSQTDLDELLRLRGPGDRTSVHSHSYDESSKRRSHYFEDKVRYRDGVTDMAREKVVRQSPVIAELKTNVIVS